MRATVPTGSFPEPFPRTPDFAGFSGKIGRFSEVVEKGRTEEWSQP